MSLRIDQSINNPSKTNTKTILGPTGAQTILEAISNDRPVGTVCIGGINHSNVQRILYQSQSPKKTLDGVAVVSAIVAAENPRHASAELAKLIRSPPAFATAPKSPRPNEVAALLQEVPNVTKKVAVDHPLAHSMVNQVVINFVANVVLSM